MKGIVLEIRDGKAAVLAEDGTVVTSEQKCRVGETIKLKSQTASFRRSSSYQASRFASVAAALVITAGIGGGFGLYHYTFQPYSYVSLDVNPSFEYAVNRLDKVITVTAVNEDAQTAAAALNESGIWGLTLSEVIDRTIDELIEEGHLEDGDESVLISVSSDDDTSAQELNTQLQNSRLYSADTSYDVTIHTTDTSTRDEAYENNISTGRYVEAGFGDTSENSSSSGGSGSDTSGAVSGESQPGSDGSNAPGSETGNPMGSISMEDARNMDVGQLVQWAREKNDPGSENPSGAKNSSGGAGNRGEPSSPSAAGSASAPGGSENSAGNGNASMPDDMKNSSGNTSMYGDMKNSPGGTSAPDSGSGSTSGDTSVPSDAGNAPGGSSASSDAGNAQGGSSVPSDAGNTQGGSSAPSDAGNTQGNSSAPSDAGNTQGSSSAPSDAGNIQGGSSVPSDAGNIQGSSSAPSDAGNAQGSTSAPSNSGHEGGGSSAPSNTGNAPGGTSAPGEGS